MSDQREGLPSMAGGVATLLGAGSHSTWNSALLESAGFVDFTHYGVRDATKMVLKQKYPPLPYPLRWITIECRSSRLTIGATPRNHGAAALAAAGEGTVPEGGVTG